MFYQFHVYPEHRDYLRFLWWRNGDLSTTPCIFKMKVHLFSATSSPACANFCLKRITADERGRFSEEVCDFLKQDFYVDDGLASCSSSQEAIQLIRGAQASCYAGNLRLHKFVSKALRL
ncbi:uncharacterized protein LOC143252288 [Tachypleus tridentatus]|uniref:uncharacterized protein LOC143252288 n=1 Tax=Tachypleus tridentatus TaxID=6853 RepID=UPI003FD0182B